MHANSGKHVNLNFVARGEYLRIRPYKLDISNKVNTLIVAGIKSSGTKS